MPKKSANSFKVKRGNDYITVGPYTHPQTGKKGWRFGYQEQPGPGNPWRRITKPTKDEARLAAENVLNERGEGIVWSGLTPERRRFHEAIERNCPVAEESVLLAFLSSRRKSAEIVATVARFVAFKRAAAGEETPHLRGVRNILEEMADIFAGKAMADIHYPDLEAWWIARGEGLTAKRKNDLRGALVSLWAWAKREGLTGPEAVTVAERLPTSKVGKGSRRILSADEIDRLLFEAAPDFRAAIILSAFAGLRPEEASPPQKKGSKKANKRGIHCEEIDWRFGCIRLPAEVSKVDFPRNIPLSAACRAGLEWAGIREGMTGPVCKLNLTEAEETIRLGKLVFGGKWPQDALRHSYGSYRNATLRDLGKVAEEMGTSIAMMMRHYHNPQPPELGDAWFSWRPPGAKRCDKSSISQESPPGTVAANA